MVTSFAIAPWPNNWASHHEPLRNIEELAAYFAAQIRAFYPEGPYVIAGFCAGGTTAFELSRHLMQQRTAPDFLGLFGCPFPTTYRLLPRVRKELGNHFKRVLKHARKLSSLPLQRRGVGEIDPIRPILPLRPDKSPVPESVLLLRNKLEAATIAAVRRYTPNHFAGRLGLFLPSKEWVRSDRDCLRWKSVAQHAREYFGPGGCRPDEMLREPYVLTFAELFRQCRTDWLGRVRGSPIRPLQAQLLNFEVRSG
jgi:hypothetical protein